MKTAKGEEYVNNLKKRNSVIASEDLTGSMETETSANDASSLDNIIIISENDNRTLEVNLSTADIINEYSDTVLEENLKEEILEEENVEEENMNEEQPEEETVEKIVEELVIMFQRAYLVKGETEKLFLASHSSWLEYRNEEYNSLPDETAESILEKKIILLNNDLKCSKTL